LEQDVDAGAVTMNETDADVDPDILLTGSLDDGEGFEVGHGFLFHVSCFLIVRDKPMRGLCRDFFDRAVTFTVSAESVIEGLIQFPSLLLHVPARPRVS
jgi:hypothetical protein